jgi:hypothetical protein
MSLSRRRWKAATAASSCLATVLTVAGLTGRPRIGNSAVATFRVERPGAGPIILAPFHAFGLHGLQHRQGDR